MLEVDSTLLRDPLTMSRRKWLQLACSSGGAALLAATNVGWAAKPEAGLAKLIVRSADPLNAEPALKDLVANWITPNELFYIRSHAAAPQIDTKEFTLTVTGLVNKPLVLRVEELVERFALNSAVATLTCAGNRRTEFNQIKPVGGVQWESGAIGNAKWTGVLLSEVLKAAGVQSGAKHVWFEGADEISHQGYTANFGGSIPLEKAMSNSSELPGTLLATQMNDTVLSPDHGFPLRTVVPGYIGARSVKWLNRIIVSNQPSANHYLADAYKLVKDDEASSRAAAQPLYENIVNGAICIPAPHASQQAGHEFTVSGYALPSGKPACTVTKVEVSSDGGTTWQAAELGEDSAPGCWRMWRTKITITNPKHNELLARVTDSSGAMQPEKVDWNLKGYMFNAWYRTPIKLQPGGL